MDLDALKTSLAEHMARFGAHTSAGAYVGKLDEIQGWLDADLIVICGEHDCPGWFFWILKVAPVKRLYVYGDGAVWVLGKAAMRKVANGADWLDVGRLLSAQHNWKTNNWSKLPKSLYCNRGDYQLGRLDDDVRVVSYDFRSEIDAICAKATRPNVLQTILGYSS